MRADILLAVTICKNDQRNESAAFHVLFAIYL